MTSGLPTEILEQRAADQRRRLHHSVAELRMTMKDRLDIRRNTEEYARRHFPQAAVAVGIIGLAFGWAIGGIFSA